MSKNVEIYDTTLRDGSQSEGVAFSVEDKLAIAEILDGLGFHYIEGGNPASNQKDREFFARAAKMNLKNAVLTAFGSTRRKDIKAADDANVKALIASGAKVACIFGKSSVLHVEQILQTTKEENINMIFDTVTALKQAGMRVFFDAEHYFDGFLLDSEYALSSLDAAQRAGAQRLILCDTNGGMTMEGIRDIFRQSARRFPGAVFGIHCHDDSGLGVANSVICVEEGAKQVQGTFLGIGERCGNANLSTIVPDLQVKMGYDCVSEEALANFTYAARAIAEISNMRLGNMPYVGKSAFSHKAGMHADGVLKNETSFEHVPPSTVGNERRFLLSEQMGRASLLKRIQLIAPKVDKDSPELKNLLSVIKEKEANGFHYEAADSSFELLVRKALGMYRPFFDVVSYKILDEDKSATGYTATAVVKVMVESTLTVAAAEGEGPVHALDLALGNALEKAYPVLSEVHLTDYKVRVMDSGSATAAVVRVLVTTSDSKKSWTTVGAAADIIKASFLALADAIDYKLMNNE